MFVDPATNGAEGYIRFADNLRSFMLWLAEYQLGFDADDFKEFLNTIAAHQPEFNYAAGTAVSIATDGNNAHSLFKIKANISAGDVIKIGQAWNYLDAACAFLMAGLLIYQVANDEVNEDLKVENSLKASVLIASGAVLTAATALGAGPWGFVFATIADFAIASYDFYKSYQMKNDFDYWLEDQLVELDFLKRKYEEIENKKDKKAKDYKKADDYKNKIEELEKDIKAYSNKYLSKTNKDQSPYDVYKGKVTDICKLRNLNYISPPSSSRFEQNYFNQWSAKKIERAEKIEKKLNDAVNENGLNVVIKFASMIAMIGIAVALSMHPIGLAISIAVAASYLIYKCGIPLAQKLWNKFVDDNNDWHSYNYIFSDNDPESLSEYKDNTNEKTNALQSIILDLVYASRKSLGISEFFGGGEEVDLNGYGLNGKVRVTTTIKAVLESQAVIGEYNNKTKPDGITITEKSVKDFREFIFSELKNKIETRNMNASIFSKACRTEASTLFYNKVKEIDLSSQSTTSPQA